MNRFSLMLALVFLAGCDPNYWEYLQHFQDSYGTVPDQGEQPDTGSHSQKLEVTFELQTQTEYTTLFGVTMPRGFDWVRVTPYLNAIAQQERDILSDEGEVQPLSVWTMPSSTLQLFWEVQMHDGRHASGFTDVFQTPSVPAIKVFPPRLASISGELSFELNIKEGWVGECAIRGDTQTETSVLLGWGRCEDGLNTVPMGLLPNTHYTNVVVQSNDFKSDPISFQTPGFEISLTSEAKKSGTLSLSWSHLGRQYIEVWVYCFMETDGFNVTLPGDFTEYERSGLIPGAKYTCDVKGIVAMDQYTWLLWEGSNALQVTVPGVATDSPSLKVTLLSAWTASPPADQAMVIGSTGVTGLVFRLEGVGTAARLTSLTLSASGKVSGGDIANISLYRDGDKVPFAMAGQMTEQNGKLVYTWSAVSNLLPEVILPGAPVLITCLYNVGSENMARLGDNFRFGVTANDITVVDLNRLPIPVSGSATAIGNTIIVPFAVTISGDAPTGNQTQAIVAGTQLGRFKITNCGNAKISIDKVKLAEGGSHGSTTCNLYLSDQNSSNYTGNLFVKGIDCARGIDWAGLSSFWIDGGAYRYLTVTISSIGAAVSGDTFQLSVAALGDLTFDVRDYDLVYDGNVDGSYLSVNAGLPVVGKPSLATLTKQ